MGEKYLTMAEINRQFDKQWVLIDRPTYHWWRRDELTGGYVILHGPDRRDFEQRLVEMVDSGWKSPHIASLYIGKMEHEDPYGGFIFEEDPCVRLSTPPTGGSW